MAHGETVENRALNVARESFVNFALPIRRTGGAETQRDGVMFMNGLH